MQELQIIVCDNAAVGPETRNDTAPALWNWQESSISIRQNNETLDGGLREEGISHNSSRPPDAETLIVTSA
jgi:hypothetical protein